MTYGSKFIDATKPKTQTSEEVPPTIEHLDFTPGPTQCECPGGNAGPGCEHRGRCQVEATFFTNLHMINECKIPGLTPNGGATRLLCGECTLEHVQRAEFMAGKARQAAHWSGRPIVCSTCGKGITQAADFLEVKKLDEVEGWV